MSESDGKRRGELPQDQEASARARSERDERIDEVIRLMTSLKWQGHRTAKQLAEKWGIAHGTVSEYAREASSVISRTVDAKFVAEVKAEILASVAEIHALSKAEGDWKAAISSADTLLKGIGAYVTKVEQVKPDASPEETLASLDAAREKLVAAIQAKKAERN